MKRLLLALALSLVLAGCGQVPSSAEDFQGAEREVAQKLEELQEAGQGRQPEDICSNILSRAVVDELEAARTDCVAEMRKAIEDVDEHDLEVREVQIQGTRATATVRQGTEGPTTRVELVREGDEWRVASLGGAAGAS